MKAQPATQKGGERETAKEISLGGLNGEENSFPGSAQRRRNKKKKKIGAAGGGGENKVEKKRYERGEEGKGPPGKISTQIQKQGSRLGARARKLSLFKKKQKIGRSAEEQRNLNFYDAGSRINFGQIKEKGIERS